MRLNIKKGISWILAVSMAVSTICINTTVKEVNAVSSTTYTEYRYRTIESYEYKYSVAAEMGGDWEFVSKETNTSYGEYGSWSAWQKTAVTASDTRDVQKENVAATYKTQYQYERCYGKGSTGYYYSYPWQSGVCQTWEWTNWLDNPLPCEGLDSSINAGAYYYGRGYDVNGNYVTGQNGSRWDIPWWSQNTRQVEKTAAYTRYRYRDRIKTVTTTYTYRKPIWSEWSDWSTTYIEATAERQVDTRTSEGVAIDSNSFPDDSFRAYIINNVDIDSKGYLSEEEQNSVKYINLADSGVNDLKGIEAFPNLETLQCQNNNIKTLDLSGNKNLKTVFAYNNDLDSLDVSNNTALKTLYCWGNDFTSVDVSKLDYANLSYDDALYNSSELVELDYDKKVLKYGEKKDSSGDRLPIVLVGDMNHDGVVDDSDPTELRNRIDNAATNPINDIDHLYGDVNGDGKVDMDDVQDLYDYVYKKSLGQEVPPLAATQLLNYIKVSTSLVSLPCYVGDDVPTSGVTVTAFYRNGSSQNVNNYTVKGDTSSAGAKSALVSYTEGNITKTGSYNIKVSEKEVIKPTEAPKPTQKPSKQSTQTSTQQPTTQQQVQPATQQQVVAAPAEVAVGKMNQVITAKSVKKAFKKKKFNINAKTNGDGGLQFTSSNKKVAKISSTGKVSIKGIGKTTITIKAGATAGYNEAEKKITLTVVPKKQSVKLSSPARGRMNISWKKDKKISKYQVQISENKKFKKNTLQKEFAKNQSSVSVPMGSKSGKTLYVRVRSYKVVKGKKYYSSWSKVKNITVR